MRALVLLAALAAAAPQAQIATGDALPLATASWPTADGGTGTFAEASGPAGLVVVFWSNACPWSERYGERLADLAARYGPAGVGMLLVNSNDPSRLEGESALATLERLATFAISAPVLLDVDGRLAAAFGARSAPHAFLFDPSGTLLYDGAIDDSPSSSARVERAWLAEALDQVVAGMPVIVQKTQPFGCRLRLAEASSAPPPPPPAP